MAGGGVMEAEEEEVHRTVAEITLVETHEEVKGRVMAEEMRITEVAQEEPTKTTEVTRILGTDSNSNSNRSRRSIPPMFLLAPT